MSRRDQIRRSEEEQREFIRGGRTVILNTVARDGVPHPIPMWYAIEGAAETLRHVLSGEKAVSVVQRM